jgi:hypothetical protein
MRGRLHFGGQPPPRKTGPFQGDDPVGMSCLAPCRDFSRAARACLVQKKASQGTAFRGPAANHRLSRWRVVRDARPHIRPRVRPRVREAKDQGWTLKVVPDHRLKLGTHQAAGSQTKITT